MANAGTLNRLKRLEKQAAALPAPEPRLPRAVREFIARLDAGTSTDADWLWYVRWLARTGHNGFDLLPAERVQAVIGWYAAEVAAVEAGQRFGPDSEEARRLGAACDDAKFQAYPEPPEWYLESYHYIPPGKDRAATLREFWLTRLGRPDVGSGGILKSFDGLGDLFRAAEALQKERAAQAQPAAAPTQ